MTTTTLYNGRLGNQIIRNLAVSLIAEKHNLYVNYSNYNLIESLGINLYIGKNNYDTTIQLNDDNYFSVLNSSEKIENNLNANDSFFQTKEISRMLYNYLNSAQVMENIKLKNVFNFRYKYNNDLFIHIRLTDAAKFNPGIDYYINTIKIINFDNLYISTDQRDHSIIDNIIKAYPNCIILDYNEISTIQFGSTCNNIILSHGSFSALIGYLSFHSKVYYPEYEENKIWYGDMFSIDGWTKCKVK